MTSSILYIKNLNLAVPARRATDAAMNTHAAAEHAARHPSPSEFAFAVMRCSVAHLAIGVGTTDPNPPGGGDEGDSSSSAASGTASATSEPGFQNIDTDAANLLADVLGRYIETIGLSARENANAAGRTKANAYDVLNAFGTLAPRPLSITDLYRYAADSGLEMPFERAVAQFPARKKTRGRAYGSGVSPAEFHSAPRPAHVPAFLPPFPAGHTAVAATRGGAHVSSSASSKGGQRRKKRIRHQQDAQAALTHLHGRGASVGTVDDEAGQIGGSGALQSQKKKSKLRHQQVSGSGSRSSSSDSAAAASARASPSASAVSSPCTPSKR